MNKLQNIKWHDWLILTGILMAVLVNPLTGQFIISGILFVYEAMLSVTDYFLLVGLTLIGVGYLGNRLSNRDKKNSRLAKLKHVRTERAGKYIAT